MKIHNANGKTSHQNQTERVSGSCVRVSKIVSTLKFCPVSEACNDYEYNYHHWVGGLV